MIAAHEQTDATTVRRLATRLEQLLSDPDATSLQVVDGLFEGGLPGVALPVERLHRFLVEALAEAAQSDGPEWLFRAVGRFLERATNAAALG